MPAPEWIQRTLKLPFITVACGSQTNLYVFPFLRVTVTVFVPTKDTVVISLFRPGPVRRKLWMFDLSETVIVYRPAFTDLNVLPAFLSVMVKPGPTVPVSFGVTACEDAAMANDPTTAAVSRMSMRTRIKTSPSE